MKYEMQWTVLSSAEILHPVQLLSDFRLREFFLSFSIFIFFSGVMTSFVYIEKEIEKESKKEKEKKTIKSSLSFH